MIRPNLLGGILRNMKDKTRNFDQMSFKYRKHDSENFFYVPLKNNNSYYQAKGQLKSSLNEVKIK